MPTSERAREEFEDLRNQLDQSEPDSEEFRQIFLGIKGLAEKGVVEAAGVVAEILAFDPSLRNPADAYRFYNIAKAADGYSVRFHNVSGDPDHYQGEDGDFRNEAQVSDLVHELGFERCKELDRQADAWRSRYSGK